MLRTRQSRIRPLPASGGLAREVLPMPVQSDPAVRLAVAASMLPANRSRACAEFKVCRGELSRVPVEVALTRLEPPAAGATNERRLELADSALMSAAAAGIEPVAWCDPRYPALLDCIPDPPPVLWTRGDSRLMCRPAVAIVGSRAGTEYARQMAARLAEELAGCGIVVVSGLARGVDSAAHQGCLSAGGATVGVLGSGPDVVYPKENRELAASICKTGALVSELGPAAPPLQEHFPLRNRLISGISLGVVVVEASERSGSLITARYALEQGRDVMAVPGSALSGRNRGSHALLKDGAKVVESADDILQGLGWPSQAASSAGPGAPESDPLLSRMDAGEVYRLDELILLTGIAGPRLLPRLTELELQGRVVSTPLGGFARVTAK